MDTTSTVILWPSKLKINAKSKKGTRNLWGISVHVCVLDPQVKVAGPLEGVNKARDMILEELDTKNNRVTLKINIANSEHSHVIGREGSNIRKGKETYTYLLNLISSLSLSQYIKTHSVIFIFLIPIDFLMEKRVIKSQLLDHYQPLI